MDAQQVFDHVLTHLRNQNVRSTKGGVCSYRGENGTSCAVGCLITDEEYLPQMEGRYNSVTVLHEKGILPERLVPHIELLRRLQLAHDQWMPYVGKGSIPAWESAMEFWAKDQNLVYTNH